MNETTLEVIQTTRPFAGSTKFAARLSEETATRIAHEHWDVVSIDPVSDNGSGHYHSIKTRKGYCALVGVVDGHPAILNKLDDGTRELIRYARIDGSKCGNCECEACTMQTTNDKTPTLSPIVAENLWIMLPSDESLTPCRIMMDGAEGKRIEFLNTPEPIRDRIGEHELNHFARVVLATLERGEKTGTFNGAKWLMLQGRKITAGERFQWFGRNVRVTVGSPAGDPFNVIHFLDTDWDEAHECYAFNIWENEI